MRNPGRSILKSQRNQRATWPYPTSPHLPLSLNHVSITEIDMFTVLTYQFWDEKTDPIWTTTIQRLRAMGKSEFWKVLLLWEWVVSESGLKSLIIEYDALLLTAAALFLPQRRLSASFVGNGTNVDSKHLGLNCECVCVHLHLIYFDGFNIMVINLWLQFL